MSRLICENGGLPDTEELPKIIGLGLSRTGTMALCTHISSLGFPVRHYSLGLYAHQEELFGKEKPTCAHKGRLAHRRIGRAIDYYSSIDAKTILMDKTCIFDLPVPLYIDELFDLHPNAVYVYTHRSMKKWLTSMKWLFEEGKYLWRFNELDYSLMNRVYGCTVYNEDCLVASRVEYEKKILEKIADNKINYHDINIDESEITPALLRTILKLPVTHTAEDTRSIRVNERTSPSLYQKIDYRLSQSIPGYQSFLNILK